MHLVGLFVGAGGGHGQLITHRPEAEQTDTELPLNALDTICFETPLYGIADVGGHVTEIRDSMIVPRYTVTIIGDHQIMLAPLPPPRDGHVTCASVDAVLHELGHCFEGIALGQRNDGDRVPVVSNAEPSGGSRFVFPGLDPGHMTIKKARNSTETCIWSVHQDTCESLMPESPAIDVHPHCVVAVRISVVPQAALAPMLQRSALGCLRQGSSVDTAPLSIFLFGKLPIFPAIKEKGHPLTQIACNNLTDKHIVIPCWHYACQLAVQVS